ncbi:hypothetical protein BaRGS_00018633 [Batillaria attramentaria]|uniref:MAM domain-containing protein n=1 Tax=Batillaria attramentaria TaxID=370345 RepID=A0ABD0KSS0_9CAEN
MLFIFSHLRSINDLFYVIGGYASFNVSSLPANAAARLESPWVCATGDKTYTLDFEYFLGTDNKCRLSVLLQTPTDTITVWGSQHGRELSFLFSWQDSFVHLECPVTPFKIIFEGRKLTDGRCGERYNQIDIRYIDFREANGSQSPVSTCPPTRWTSQAPSELHTSEALAGESSTTLTEEAATDLASYYTTDDTSIGIGVIAGIVCGIVVAAVMAVIIIILMVKRRRKNNRPPTGASLTPAPQRTSPDPGSAPASSDGYETPHDYQNTMHDLTATTSTSLPAGSVPEMESTAVAHAAPENYERLETRHDDAEYYTSLKTSSAVESAAGGDNYEMLSRGTSTHDYTALSPKK